jgi:hypothetical protein
MAGQYETNLSGAAAILFAQAIQNPRRARSGPVSDAGGRQGNLAGVVASMLAQASQSQKKPPPAVLQSIDETRAM